MSDLTIQVKKRILNVPGLHLTAKMRPCDAKSYQPVLTVIGRVKLLSNTAVDSRVFEHLATQIDELITTEGEARNICSTLNGIDHATLSADEQTRLLNRLNELRPFSR